MNSALRTVLPLGILAGAVGILSACMPLATQWSDDADGVEFDIFTDGSKPDADLDPPELKVMTWNLKFAGSRYDFFFDGWGDQIHMSEEEVQASLEGIYALIEEQDPDILMAQEVDVGSKRSAYVDMVDEILTNTDFKYAAWVPAWKVTYIPEEGLGRVEMGQAVFSKYPIQTNIRYDLPQNKEDSFIVNYFWLHRAIQETSIRVGKERNLVILNNHPTAYATGGLKVDHLTAIQEKAMEHEDELLIVGGDLNVVPPGTINIDSFADQADVSGTTGVTEVTYSQAEMDAMEPFYERYTPIVSLEDYRNAATEEEQSQWFTHSLTKTVFWTQKLDYMFTNGTWLEGATLQKPGDGNPATVYDPMLLSDHAPMVGVLEWEGAQ